MFFLPPLNNFAGLIICCFLCLAPSELCAASSASAAPSAPADTKPTQPAVTVSKPVGDSSAVDSAPQPSVSASTASGGTSLGAADGDYVFKPGDIIDLIVYREQDLNIRSKIAKDGMVQLPLLGELKLGGLNVRSATALITQKYNADYLVDPQIYLNIAAYNSRKFTIIGQVTKPGTYEFGGGESLDLLEAIGMAGGFTRIADRGHVVIKRREGNSVRTLKVNAKKLSDSGVARFDIEPGDVINIGESWY